jgi:hypothetical protein
MSLKHHVRYRRSCHGGIPGQEFPVGAESCVMLAGKRVGKEERDEKGRDKEEIKKEREIE